MRRAPQQTRGFHDHATVMRGGDLKVVLLRDQQVTGQRIFRFDERTGATGERLGPRAHARDEQVAQLVPAGKTQLLRQTHQRSRLHLRALGHFAHRRDRDFIGMIEQEPCSHLELRTQFGEARPDQGGELVKTVWHAIYRANGR